MFKLDSRQLGNYIFTLSSYTDLIRNTKMKDHNIQSKSIIFCYASQLVVIYTNPVKINSLVVSKPNDITCKHQDITNICHQSEQIGSFQRSEPISHRQSGSVTNGRVSFVIICRHVKLNPTENANHERLQNKKPTKYQNISHCNTVIIPRLGLFVQIFGRFDTNRIEACM